MKLSRRSLLQTGGSAAILAATAGCDKLIQLGIPPLWQAAEGPFDPPTGDGIDEFTHAINRMTFGQRPGDYARVRRMGVDAFVNEQLAPEKIADADAEHAVRRLESLEAPLGELFEYKEDFLLREMTRGTILRAALSKRQLYEVMVHFWTDHFNIDSSKGDCRWLKAADDRDVIRKHALGRFSDLLAASAISPAMLWYLDGRVNKKTQPSDRPNENYARELMELHTLGVHGGYSQRDVMEVARCLTGWTVRSEEVFKKGQVDFRPEWHDDGEKEVLGQRMPAGLGRDDLKRVLDIVSAHPATARYIATKLCRHFIADDPPSGAVETVAAAFQTSEGDIRTTLRALFATEDFQTSQGMKFKRPMHFIISALRATGATTDAGPGIIDYLPRMGHSPFQYPTPDGYPDEASPWMGTLLWRWNFAVALADNHIPGTKVDVAALSTAARGENGLMAHLLGRKPTIAELQSYFSSGAGVGLTLASPAFQRC